MITTTSEALITRVTFKVDIKKGYLKTNEIICVIGDCAELGQWNIKSSVELEYTEESQSENLENYSVWTVTVPIPQSTKITYKYILVDKSRASSPILVEWEANKGESRSVLVDGIDMFINDGLFGVIGSANKPWVGRGWLPEYEYQLRIQLQVDENPVIIFNSTESYDSFVLRLHDPHGLSQDFKLPIHTYTELVLHANSLDHLHFSASVLLLEDGANTNTENNNNIIKNSSNHVSLIGGLHSSGILSLKNAPIKENFVVIGKSYITSSQVQKKWGKIYAPIITDKGMVIGEFRCNYLVVTPFCHPNNSLSQLWHTFVEHPKSLIGHRGNGKNNFGINTSAITENTVLSFLTAARFGAKMIEFDLQLTYDKHPVIFHDYEIEIETIEGVIMKESINRLTLDQFLKLKPQKQISNPLSHAMSRMKQLRISKSTGDLNLLLNESGSNTSTAGAITTNKHHNNHTQDHNNNNNNNNNNNHNHNHHHSPTGVFDTVSISSGNSNGTQLSQQPNYIHDRYSTLQESFVFVPQEIGFLIEIKYPNLEMQNLRNFTSPERNIFIDIILNIVFNEAKDRRIAFLTFDPDIAILLRTKQFRYPVLFLICSDTPNFFSVFDPDVNVFDTRGNSIKNAITFVKTVNLDGIVCDSETILADHSLVDLVHKDNLLLFTYGSKNVDPINVKTQTDLGVDGIIADNMTKLSKKLRESNIPTI
ncbi:hypothetical protein DLAC_03460 [Tieghemostelium lacteum]|uniref:Uncharacterized protein n=1 Tax=Tieghemostelium lacteum TaxID=361077 RepID=A0A152A262_TIELA|nr:hypothetical protein DLAC_03460 [Tieghemostelium lacteum]|eukprot:KYR00294.1 hypothetical protein DLAC_03460 [Tieghemostelium lacteum]